jgi:WS/DGAT/MGAT family acyltransferase
MSAPAATPSPAQPMTSVDRAWLRMGDGTNLMQINGVLALDGPLALDRFKDIVRRRLLTVPRFRQRVVWRGGQMCWEDDPELDLDRHVKGVELPAPGGVEALAELVGRFLATPLDQSRPLWEMWVVDGYEGHRSVVLGQIHHAIGDGVALMMVLLSLTDPVEEEGGGVNPLHSFFEHPDRLDEARQYGDRILPEMMRLLVAPMEAMAKVPAPLRWLAWLKGLLRLLLLPPDTRTRFKGKLAVEKRAAWSDPIAVEEVKAVGRALGGTINDVLLTAMAGGLRRYLAQFGEPRRSLSFRAAMPVSLRPLAQLAALGNQFGLAFLPLPIGISDPVERLRELHRRADKLKRSAEPWVVIAILRLMGSVPAWVQRIIVALFGAKVTAVMTNVPGPHQTLYLGGRAIREFFFWVPQAGKLSLGISILSYAGQVRLGIAADARLVPDPGPIVRGFHDEFRELQRRAAEIAKTG